jgi:hypothetical protein
MELNDKLLDLLCVNNPLNVMNSLVHAFGTWSRKHISGQGAESRMREAFSLLAHVAYSTANQGSPHRNKWPEGRTLPCPDNDPRIHATITRQVLRKMRGLSFEEGLTFIGQLWGQWLLMCPAELLSDTSGSPEAQPFDDEKVIHQMLRYLDVYGNM